MFLELTVPGTDDSDNSGVISVPVSSSLALLPRSAQDSASRGREEYGPTSKSYNQWSATPGYMRGTPLGHDDAGYNQHCHERSVVPKAGLESWLLSLICHWLWTSELDLLNLSFFICKMGREALKMISLTLRGQPLQRIRNTLNMLIKCETHTDFQMLDFSFKKQILGLRK